MKRDEIERLVNNPQDPANAAVAARVYADAALWPSVERALYPDAEPTDAERRTIRRVVAERTGAARARREARLRAFVAGRLDRISGGMGDYALAAAPKDPRTAPSDAGKGEAVTFVFVSESTDGLGESRFAWRAELTLPADAAVDALLPIAVTDRAGEAVSGGIFKVAGAALPVAAGRTEIPYGLFLSGLKDASVEFVTAEGVRSPGTLALF